MRNNMHSFAATPAANIPRSRFDMPCNVKFTGNTGDLIPFYVCEVLPGDTFDVNTSIVCRLQTLIHPIFDNIYLDTYYFFVPNRLVWDNWKHFMGEPDQAWIPTQDWTVPQIQRRVVFDKTDTGATSTYNYDVCFKDTIVDYMGIGADAITSIDKTGFTMAGINALPIRAYNKIYDDWFRDENLIDPINLYTGDNDVDGYSSASYAVDPLKGGKCYKAAKLHDYFTSALPQAQRGNAAILRTGLNPDQPIVKTSSTVFNTGNTYGMHMHRHDNYNNASITNKTVSDQTVFGLNASNTPQTASALYYPDNLYADLSNLNLGISINDLRMAFQVQKFMERSARGGARYIELIKSMFGVTSPDARLQRSEYLGGHRVPINIHQIVNTTETVSTPLGNTGAMSVTSDVHNDFIHSFTEHGYVIGICCVRYKHSYPQGMDRMWSRSTKFDFYFPVFANIGEQPIRNREIYFSNLTGDQFNVFGYQEAWADYRYKPNRVMGEMRPNINNTLASWHLSDSYTSQPILSKAWIQEDLAPIDRALAVSHTAADQMLFDILVNNKATRPMPLYSIPGLVDHF